MAKTKLPQTEEEQIKYYGTSPWNWIYCANCCGPSHLCKCDEEQKIEKETGN